MNAWLVSIAGIVALSVLVDIVVPEGETNKYIKGIFSIITILVIITPIVSFISKDIAINDFIHNNTPSLAINQAFLERTNQDMNALTEEALEKYLKELGYKNIDVRIYLDYENNLSYVTLDINNLSIDDNVSHINITVSHINITDKLKDIVSVSLNTNRERVIIYGIYRG